MLKQLENPNLREAIWRLKNNKDFQMLMAFLEENLYYVAVQAVKSGGETKHEFSGGYKLLEELIGLCYLKEFNPEKEPAGRRFIV